MKRVTKIVSIDFEQREFSYLESVAKEKNMSQSAILRQALKLYNSLDKKLSGGGRLYFMNLDGTMEPAFDGGHKA